MMYPHTGWTGVQRDENIDFESENTELEIKTNIQPESVEEANLKVQFLGDQGHHDVAAGFTLHLLKPPHTYKLWKCHLSRKCFPVDLPRAAEKVWRIKRVSTERRLVIHCNDVEVLNIVVSNTTCDDTGMSVARWGKKVTKISFPDTDTASDFYRLSPIIGRSFA